MMLSNFRGCLLIDRMYKKAASIDIACELNIRDTLLKINLNLIHLFATFFISITKDQKIHNKFNPRNFSKDCLDPPQFLFSSQ